MPGHGYHFTIPAEKRERANLGNYQPGPLADKRQVWEAWNATMPPIAGGAMVNLGCGVMNMP